MTGQIFWGLLLHRRSLICEPPHKLVASLSRSHVSGLDPGLLGRSRARRLFAPRGLLDHPPARGTLLGRDPPPNGGPYQTRTIAAHPARRASKNADADASRTANFAPTRHIRAKPLFSQEVHLRAYFEMEGIHQSALSLS